MGDVQLNVIARLMARYGPPEADDLESFYGLYDLLLEDYPDDVLVRALDAVCRDHRGSSWPLPGTISGRCRRLLARAVFSRQTPEQAWAEPSDGEKARAKKLYSVFMQAGFGPPRPAEPPRVRTVPGRQEFETMQRRSRSHRLHGRGTGGGYDRDR